MKSRVTLSIVAAMVAVGGLLAFQATRTGTALVLQPSELVELPSEAVRERIRVAGRVLPQGIDYQVEPSMVLKFKVRDAGTDKETEGEPKERKESAVALPVVYEGLKPDMFAGGRDVIIDGDFKGGQLVATRLLTQCPSKYEPPTPGGEAAKEGAPSMPQAPVAGASDAAKARMKSY